MPAFSVASRPSNSSDILFRASSEPPPAVGRLLRAAGSNFDLSQRFWCRACGGHGFNEQIFGADEQVPKGGCGRCPKNDPLRLIDDGCKQEEFGPACAERGGPNS